MQTLGYMDLTHPTEKITKRLKVLVRQGKYGRHVKIRGGGEDGTHFIDEQNFLNESISEKYTEVLESLLEGKSIFI